MDVIEKECNPEESKQNKTEINSKLVVILSRVMPDMMKQAQEEDVDISKDMHHVNLGKKPILAQIRNIKSKTVCRYLQIVLSWGPYT